MGGKPSKGTPADKRLKKNKTPTVPKTTSKPKSSGGKTASPKLTSSSGKKGPPRPKHTAGLPPGLAKYWGNKGVPK